MKNDIIENIRLDLENAKIKSSISVRQNDTKTRSVHITLTNGSSVVSLEHALMALILIKKPNRDECYNDCVISGNEIQYTLTTQTINVVGTCVCQIRVIFDDEAEVLSPEFTILVYNPVVLDVGIESMNEYKAANAMLAQVDDARRQAEIYASMSHDSADLSTLTYESILEYKDQIDEIYNLALQAKQDVVDEVNKAADYSEEAEKYRDESKTFKDLAASLALETEGYKESAHGYKTLAETAKSGADMSKYYASESATKAKEEADRAESYREGMEDNVTACSNSASASASDAELSKSYAVGGTGRRQDEDTDNAAYYYEETKRISGGLSGGLKPMGTIAFADLQSQTKGTGFMYNISDAFTSDNTFKDGAGKKYPSGTNVFWTDDGYWDCMVGNSVVGVKGDSEATYRTGEVNITKADIGLGNVPNVSTNNQSPTFTQATTRTNIVSGETLTVLLGKLQKVIADLSAVAYSGEYSDLSNIPTSYIPSSHASSGTTYGVGTTSKYGHCMTINALTTSSHVNGKALSAYQGYVLDAKITALDKRIKALEDVSGYPFTPTT